MLLFESLIDALDSPGESAAELDALRSAAEALGAIGAAATKAAAVLDRLRDIPACERAAEEALARILGAGDRDPDPD